jgi:hypothetical protein
MQTISEQEGPLQGGLETSIRLFEIARRTVIQLATNETHLVSEEV